MFIIFIIQFYIKYNIKMPKNTQGGSKHKKQASKNFNTVSHKLRIAEEEGEIYAQVVKLLGNGMCHVHDVKGNKYLCIIRGKFKGRGKSGNRLGNGTWVLVGLREWESQTQKSDKLTTCDLLEVYSDNDKERLKNTVDMNWNLFITNDCNNSFIEKTDDMFEFSNQDQQEYSSLMKRIEEETNNKAPTIISFGQNNKDDSDDEINIDDI
jgi:initiation factor 1A